MLTIVMFKAGWCDLCAWCEHEFRCLQSCSDVASLVYVDVESIVGGRDVALECRVNAVRIFSMSIDVCG